MKGFGVVLAMAVLLVSGCGAERPAKLQPVDFDVFVGFDGTRSINLEKAEYKAQARYTAYVSPMLAPFRFDADLDVAGNGTVRVRESGVQVSGIMLTESRKVSQAVVRVHFAGDTPVERVPAALFGAPLCTLSTNVAIPDNLKPSEIDALIEKTDAALFDAVIRAAIRETGVKSGKPVSGSAWYPDVPKTICDGRTYSVSVGVRVLPDREN
jgi:hypothetical protein